MASSQESSKMEEEGGSGCQVPEGPVRCLNNCGFFGSVATMNLCSKCYRELHLNTSNNNTKPSFSSVPVQTLETLAPTVEMKAQPPVLAAVVMAGMSAVAAAPEEAESPQPPSRKRSNRCYSCNKRVGLTGFKCRCGDMFCAQHRYSDMHACTFDYKAAGREAIFRANPVVKAPKIEKI